jgi:hypothetical protein
MAEFSNEESGLPEYKPGSVFNRLRKLFSTDVIIRNLGGNQLKVIDIDKIQSSGNIESNRRIDRFSRLYTNVPGFSFHHGQLQLATRLELFRDYEAMDTDSIISSALDVYADECTTTNEYGDILEIKASNEKVKEVLHNLFYEVLNVEFNLWPWTRNVLKYGDFFLKLNVAEKFGVVGVDPIAAYEMIREENFDPENPHKVRFKRDYSALSARSHIASIKGEEYENWEIAHFRLLTDTNFLPYGRSLIEPGRKVWKQITLMEDAMLIHRIMRAPDKRVFKIDIGNIPPNEVDSYMQAMVDKMKKVPFIDPNTGDYNLKYNMQNILEDFYVPVRGGDTGTQIDTITGLNYETIEDINYLKGRLLGALKIPKAFLGFEEDVSGKSTLAAQDFRFGRTIERIQKIIVSELYKIAIIHLYIQGFNDIEIADFSLNLTAPSTLYDKEKIELWTSKTTLAGDMIDKKLFSRNWIYENVFKMTEEDYLKEQNRIVSDHKMLFRLEQIKTEGNDPVKTGTSFGTPHDIASLYKGGGMNNIPKGYDEREQAPPGGWPGAGRPTEPGTYGTHEHPLGWDPLGNKANRNVSEEKKVRLWQKESIIKDYKNRSIQTSIGDLLVENKDKNTLLDENNIIPEE